MQIITRTCALLVIAIATLILITQCGGQQSPLGDPPTPPPVMTFGSAQFEAPPADKPADAESTVLVEEDPVAAGANSSTESFSSSAPAHLVPQKEFDPPQIDTQIRPVANVEPQSSEPISTAQQVVQAFDVTRAGDSLPGRPISIGEAISGAPVENRMELIHAYWSTFERWARKVAVQMEAENLAALREPASMIERELIETARSLVQARLIECELDLEIAQQRLAQYLPHTESAALPLAKDLPLVHEYVTHYDTRQNRTMSHPRLGQIDRLLPKNLQIIQSRADAVARCSALIRQSIQAFNQGQIPASNTLEAIRTMRESQFEFVRTTLRYNQDIAEYAFAVAPFGQPADQVVSMLIKTHESPLRTGPALVSALGPVDSQGLNSASPTRSYPDDGPARIHTANNGATTATGEPARFRSMTDTGAMPEFGSAAQQNSLPATGNSSAGILRPAQPSEPRQSAAAPSESPPRYPSSATTGGGSFPFSNR